MIDVEQCGAESASPCTTCGDMNVTSWSLEIECVEVGMCQQKIDRQLNACATVRGAPSKSASAV